MKFVIENKNKDNISTLIRKIGYVYLGTTDKQEYNITRSFSRAGYPRFHVYLTITAEQITFNLHLDQKKPSYKGSAAHSGEYEGELVEQEAQRIKQVLK